MYRQSSFIFFAEYHSIALACLSEFPFLAIKQDNEGWNCPSQRNNRHGLRGPWGSLPCPSLIKLGYSFHIQWISGQHWILLSGFTAPYGNCLGSWHQAKGWQFLLSLLHLYSMIAHIWKSYALQSSISPGPCVITLCMMQCGAAKLFSWSILKPLIWEKDIILLYIFT